MAQSLTEADIAHVAELARLALTKDELARYTEELSAILNYVDQLQSVDTSGVEPIGQVTGLTNILQRDEVAADRIDKDQFLADAPAAQPPQLKVKVVLE